MARCGCGGNCTCKILGSDCLKASGLGSSTNPYKFDVQVDGVTINCGGDGLARVVNTQDTNTVDIEGNGSIANPLSMDVIRTPDPQVPDPDGLGVPNLLQEIPGPGGGLYVSCESVQDCVGAAVAQLLAGNDCLIYDDVANAITVQLCAAPNGLECAPVGDPDCPAGGLRVVPSTDLGNGLGFGADQRLFVSPLAVAAGDCMQPFTQAGTPADPFIFAPQVAPEQNGIECIPGAGLAVIPSSDPGNALTFGPDGRLFADICFNSLPTEIRVGEVGPCIETLGNGCDDPYRVILRLSDDPCQGICCRPDGLFVQKNTTPVPAPSILFSENWQLGAQNGNFDDRVVMAPRCLNVNNPSQCRTLFGNIRFGGVVDMQKLAGNFVVQFQTSLAGPGGPWNTAVSAAALDPDPPSPQPVRIITTLSGSEQQSFEMAPGGVQQVCVRIVLDGFFLNSGIINNSDRTFGVSFQWGDNVNTCP